MKSKIVTIFVVVGVICLAAASAFLARKLFNMPIQSAKPLKIEQPAAVAPQTLTDTTIEVGRDTDADTSDKTKTPVKVTQYASGQKTPGQPPARQPATPASGAVGKVIYLSGPASALSADGKARLLNVNAEIFRMDKIETGPNVKLEIKFIDGTMVSAGEKSSIIIDECIYSSIAPASCSFALRFSKGVCRVITGLIAQVNPDRFKVRARMATIGIRGCDLVFKSTPAKDSIYILDVGQAKSIEIDTTSNGSTVNDLNTGRTLEIDAAIKRHLSITDPQTAVTVAGGQGPVQHFIGLDESRDLITETSHLTPAHYELEQKSDGATLKITPVKKPKNNSLSPN